MENTLRTILGNGYIQGKGVKGPRKPAESSQSDEGGNFEESDIAVMLEFVEDNYSGLYGHGTGTEIKERKDKMWKQLVEVVTKV